MSAPPRENPLFSLAFNVVIPALILLKMSDDGRLGALYAFLIALAFPLCYSGYDFAKNRRVGFVPALGFVSILLTGGLGLLKVDGVWFAIKEALIPLLIGGAIVISMRTRHPLVKSLFFNARLFKVDEITTRLRSRGHEEQFARLLTTTTWLLAASFLLSAVLNFVLAVVILRSPAGTVAFNQELGKMMALSFPVIVLPCLVVTCIALFVLFRGVKHLTGLPLEQFLVNTRTGGKKSSPVDSDKGRDV